MVQNVRVRRLARILSIVGSAVVLAAVCAVAWWTLGAYEPDAVAEKAVSRARDAGGWYEYGGEGTVGVVVYPGARVDAEAYAPLASALSGRTGATVAVVRVPLDFALLDGDAAVGVITAHPEVERWVVAGHSLGGVAAAGYADENVGEAAGLLLWASYPAGGADLSGGGLAVASIRGSRDGVLDRRSLAEAKARLPADTEYVEVEGMNHAQFGSYGAQDGDGKAAITNERATQEIVAASEDLVFSVERRANLEDRPSVAAKRAISGGRK